MALCTKLLGRSNTCQAQTKSTIDEPWSMVLVLNLEPILRTTCLLMDLECRVAQPSVPSPLDGLVRLSSVLSPSQKLDNLFFMLNNHL